VVTENEQIDKGFNLKITCKKCGSKYASICFYEGFTNDCGGSTGSLSVECEQCENKIQVEGEG